MLPLRTALGQRRERGCADKRASRRSRVSRLWAIALLSGAAMVLVTGPALLPQAPILAAGAVPTASLTPTLVRLAFPLTELVGGSSTTGSINLSAPAPTAVAVALSSTQFALQVPATVTIPAGAQTASFPITTSPVAYTIPATIHASLGDVRLGTSLWIRPTVPIPAKALNVRDFGAKGDGVADDRPAIQAAIDQAKGGEGIYIPAGTYRLGAQIKLFKSNLTLYGDGAASVLAHGNNHGIWIGPTNRPTGVKITRLKFLGLPGKYKADGNTASAIVAEVGTQTPMAPGSAVMVEDCDFVGCGNPYASGGGFTKLGDGSKWYVTLSNCRIQGWGATGAFLMGGERILNCRFVQDDPSVGGQRSAHGLYIPAGSRDIVVSDTLIQNARKYAAQIWSQYPGLSIDGITFTRVTVKDCDWGIIIAKDTDPSVGSISNVLLEGCQITGTKILPALRINTGSNITIRNNVLEGPTGLSVESPKAYLKDTLITGNIIQNCPSYGIQVTPVPSEGTFSNVVLSLNRFINCRVPMQLNGTPGIAVKE
jgi:hypothetical protein